jgi:hypothetical protein
MKKLNDILNIKNSTRSMSDQEFDLSLSSLAQELEVVNYYYHYQDEELKQDWNKLCRWIPTGSSITSSSRLGMKLSEHFCPNF